MTIDLASDQFPPATTRVLNNPGRWWLHRFAYLRQTSMFLSFGLYSQFLGQLTDHLESRQARRIIT